MDIEKFKVLTLNCWGVFTPIVCKHKEERLAAIAEKLSEGYYDIILLQEIWTEFDFEKLLKKFEKIYKYSHYFHSNVIGSGCCIFTKYKILYTTFYRFSLNGYPHNINHGDWYGGKGVGLATLEVSSRKFRVNVYVTHMHARYEHKEENDKYYFHRIVQGFEFGDFIRLTSPSCDAVIVGGDFNMDESMLGFKFMTANSGIKDSWMFEKCESKTSIEHSATCDRPDSPYCNKNWNKWYPHGERLDYIFYRQNSCIKLVCKHSSLQMRAIQGLDSIHYSDHCGVEAQFEISQSPLEAADVINQDRILELSGMVQVKIADELNRIKKKCKIEYIFTVVTLLCIIFDYPNAIVTFLIGCDGIPAILNRIILFILSVISFILFWYAVVIRNHERKAVLNFRQNINWILSNSQSMSKNCNFGDEDDAYFKDKKS